MNRKDKFAPVSKQIETRLLAEVAGIEIVALCRRPPEDTAAAGFEWLSEIDDVARGGPDGDGQYDCDVENLIYLLCSIIRNSHTLSSPETF